ncbi:MAG: 3-isopropylmalate dehydratase small subunit [Deltaproteobacteria bacterium]|nr:3-isopropylmalate dehydratase small subunit [Deltaproteobacteria bacterium]
MEFTGRIWKFGNDVNTDEIIPARYLNTSDPQELAKHCMEDADPDFPSKVKPGDIIVAGANFGCGSSREHAPIALKAAGVACVIAGSFARIFYRNSFNMGLPILECTEIHDRVAEGDRLQVSLDAGIITFEKDGAVLEAEPVPEFMQALLQAGGLMNYVKKKVNL